MKMKSVISIQKKMKDKKKKKNWKTKFAAAAAVVTKKIKNKISFPLRRINIIKNFILLFNIKKEGELWGEGKVKWHQEKAHSELVLGA